MESVCYIAVFVFYALMINLWYRLLRILNLTLYLTGFKVVTFDTQSWHSSWERERWLGGYSLQVEYTLCWLSCPFQHAFIARLNLHLHYFAFQTKQEEGTSASKMASRYGDDAFGGNTQRPKSGLSRPSSAVSQQAYGPIPTAPPINPGLLSTNPLPSSAFTMAAAATSKIFILFKYNRLIIGNSWWLELQSLEVSLQSQFIFLIQLSKFTLDFSFSCYLDISKPLIPQSQIAVLIFIICLKKKCC